MNISKAISAALLLSVVSVSTGCAPVVYVPVYATQQRNVAPVPPGTPMVFMPTPLYYTAPSPVFYWSWNSRCCRARRHHCR